MWQRSLQMERTHTGPSSWECTATTTGKRWPQAQGATCDSWKATVMSKTSDTSSTLPEGSQVQIWHRPASATGDIILAACPIVECPCKDDLPCRPPRISPVHQTSYDETEERTLCCIVGTRDHVKLALHWCGEFVQEQPDILSVLGEQAPRFHGGDHLLHLVCGYASPHPSMCMCSGPSTDPNMGTSCVYWMCQPTFRLVVGGSSDNSSANFFRLEVRAHLANVSAIFRSFVGAHTHRDTATCRICLLGTP